MARGGTLDLAREVPLARTATANYVREVLEEMAARSRDGALSFTVVLDGAEAPHVSVAVELDVSPAGDAHDGELQVLAHARGRQELYPTLDGRVRTEEIDAAKTRVRLTGSYDAPLALLGGGLNALLLHGYAEASVARWFDDVIAGVDETAKRHAAEERHRIT